MLSAQIIGRFWDRYSVVIIITLAILACCLYVSPFYEVPQNDDWAYYLTVKSWLSTGVLTHNGWNDPTLVFQLYWGALFVKLFGLSYSTLRISTLVIAWAGILAFYFILLEFKIDKTLALLSALLLIFNPIALVLSYSFNTDVPYLSLTVIAQYLLLRALRSDHLFYFILTGFILACAAMVRQNAIFILLLSILYIIIFSQSKRKLFAITALTLPSILAFLIYFRWMSHQDIRGWPFVSSNPPLLISSIGPIDQLQILYNGFVNGILLLLDAPVLLLPLFLLLTFTITSEKRLFCVCFFVLFLICIFSPVSSYHDWPYFGSYLSKSGMCVQNNGRPLIRGGAVLPIVLLMIACLSALFAKSIAVFKSNRQYLPNYVVLILALGVVQLVPLLFLTHIYDRYIIVIFPALIILLTCYVQNMAIPKKWLVLIFTLFFILSADLLRGYAAAATTQWQLASKLVSRGISPSQIKLHFEWAGANLYEEAIHKYGARPPFLKKPWREFQTGECIIGHAKSYLFLETYHGPLWAGQNKVGVKDTPACRALLKNEFTDK